MEHETGNIYVPVKEKMWPPLRYTVLLKIYCILLNTKLTSNPALSKLSFPLKKVINKPINVFLVIIISDNYKLHPSLTADNKSNHVF